MAYGEIHNSTGTICKATKSCPIEGGHSKDADEYIETKAEELEVEPEVLRGLIRSGVRPAEAVSIVKDGLVTPPPSSTKSSFKKPAPNAAIGSYEMTDAKIDLHRVYPGERYYDAQGTAYIVETAQRGRFATLSPIGADGTVPPNATGADGAVRVDGFGQGGHLRRLDPPKDSRFVDGTPGQSESRAIKDLPREGSWPKSVSAVLNYRDENGDQKAIELVAPVTRLTDKKRLELGRQLWSLTGKDPARFEEVPEAEQLRWANQRIMRRENYSWKTNDDGTVSYSHRMGSGGSYDGKDIKLVEL